MASSTTLPAQPASIDPTGPSQQPVGSTPASRNGRQDIPQHHNQGGQRGGGRGRDRGQRGERGARGDNRGRGGGRGNQKARRQSQSNVAMQSAPPIPPPPGLGGGGTSGGRLSRDAETEEGESKEKSADGQEEDVEAEVCFICASPVIHNSIAPCNHRTCHICALRLRALYKTRACAHCRVSVSHTCVKVHV